MNDARTYDQQVEAILAYNQPLLDEFQDWLAHSGVSAKTVQSHVDNMAFFATYLVYYDPLQRLDEATSGDVWMFLSDWFPRKALWASTTSIRTYLTSFRKFFRWMGDTEHVSPEKVTEVLTMLKDERDAFLRAVAAW